MSSFVNPGLSLLALVEWPLFVGCFQILLGFKMSARQHALMFGIAMLSIIVIFSSLTLQDALCSSSMLFSSFNYRVDGLNILFLPLIFLCFALVFYYEKNNASKNHLPSLDGLLWLIFGMTNGFFLSDHLLLLFIFFEVSSLPFFYWIHAQDSLVAKKAAIKMFLYTANGGIFLLLGILYFLQDLTLSSWSFSAIDGIAQNTSRQTGVALCFLLAFLIKIPLWPVHSWLIHAHTQAPTSASVLLAAIMLKMGGYGMLRFNAIWFPVVLHLYAPVLFAFSVFGIVVLAILAWGQTDLKKMIAYSSICHMAFVVLSLTASSFPQAEAAHCFQAALMQMISHGLISAALFFCAGFLYNRTQSRSLDFYGGLGKIMPWMSAYMTFFLMANSALPGLSGFIAELSVLTACYPVAPVITMIAASSLFFGALLNLRILISIFYGVPTEEIERMSFESQKDCVAYEHHILISLGIAVLSIGLWPRIVWDWSSAGTQQAAMIQRAHQNERF